METMFLIAFEMKHVDFIFLYFVVASKQTPTKPAKHGRIAKNANDPNNFRGLGKRSLILKFS